MGDEPQRGRPGPDQAERTVLIKRVGRALVRIAGPRWQRLRLEYRSVGRHIEVDALVTGADGLPHPLRPPAESVEGMRVLRGGMYLPGEGTWLSAVFEIEPSGDYSLDFDSATEPAWRRVPPPIGFQDELRFFPREQAHIPDWLRARALLPPAGTAEAPEPSEPPHAAPHRPPAPPPRPGPPPPGPPARGPVPPGAHPVPQGPLGGPVTPPMGFPPPGGPPPRPVR